MGRALLYISAVVFPPLYSQNPVKIRLNYNFCLSKTRVMSFFFFSNIAVSWSRGRSADKEHTCSIYAEIVIHQTEEQVITNEGIQENTWEVVVVVGGCF